MNTTGNFLVLSVGTPEFEAVKDLDSKQFPKPWSKNDWSELNWDHHLLYAWKIDDLIQGFALLALVPNDDTAHLLKICFDSEWRGTGEAQLFWKSCIVNLKKIQVLSIYLEVETSNVRAISFYQKSGFKTLRTIKGFYSDGSDATTMHMIM